MMHEADPLSRQNSILETCVVFQEPFSQVAKASCLTHPPENQR